jgi:hypothetical protein
MYQMLFKNRWFALAFAAMILASAALLVGDGGQVPMLAHMADNLHGQGKALESQPDTPKEVTQSPPIEFIPDEELIDDGEGMDPAADQGDDSMDDGGDMGADDQAMAADDGSQNG